MGRKGFYEELKIKEHIAEMTPLMCKYVIDVMQGADEKAKESLVTKILPKIIDKGLPLMITGNEGQAIVIQVAKEILEKHDINTSSSDDSEG